jgi:hypothetical protein
MARKQNGAERLVLFNDVTDQCRVSGRAFKERPKANGLFIPGTEVVEDNWDDTGARQHFGRVAAYVSSTAGDKD